MKKKGKSDTLTDDGLEYNIGISYVMRVNLILYQCYACRRNKDIPGWISELDSLYLEVEAKLEEEEITECTSKLNKIYELLDRDTKRSQRGKGEFSAELAGGCRDFEAYLRRTKFVSELNVPEKQFDTSILV